MGLIKEPKGVDFIIESEPLTEEEQKKLSEFIEKRKQEIAAMKPEPPTKVKSARPKNADTKAKRKQRT